MPERDGGAAKSDALDAGTSVIARSGLMPKKLFSVFVGGESALFFRGAIGARGAVPPRTKCGQQPLCTNKP